MNFNVSSSQVTPCVQNVAAPMQPMYHSMNNFAYSVPPPLPSSSLLPYHSHYSNPITTQFNQNKGFFPNTQPCNANPFSSSVLYQSSINQESFNHQISISNQNSQNNSLSADQIWINEWSKTKIRNEPSEKKELIKLSDAKMLLKQAFSYIELLQTMTSELSTTDESSKDLCTKYYHSINRAKDQLSEITNLLCNDNMVQGLALKMKQRGKKRLQKKNRKQRIIQEKAISEKKSFELNNAIDNNLKMLADKELKVKEDEDMKKEADGILLEVRKKISETSQSIKLLNSLSKLRNLRKERARKNGSFTTEDTDLKFSSMIDDNKDLLEKQLKYYHAEEKALKVMIESEQEVQRKARLNENQAQMDSKVINKKIDILQALFGNDTVGPDNLYFASKSYFLLAEKSIENLIAIRENWDAYINKSKDASSIPISWVTPSQPSSEKWEQYIVDANSS